MNQRVLFAWLGLACTLPPLLAYNLTPSATLFNQLLALGLWGLVMANSNGQLQTRSQWDLHAAPWLLMLAAAGASVLINGLPLSLALAGFALVGGALFVLQWARALDGSIRQQTFTALCWGLVAAGALSTLVSIVQVFEPTWPDGVWIAHSGIPGRAIGNMRQPNHLASLLLWACIAAVWLSESRLDRANTGAARRLPPGLALSLFAFVFAVVLSASRTGMFLGVTLLALWGVLDRSLSRGARLALMLTPLMALMSAGLMVWWAHANDAAFGAESRLAEGAGSPSRIAILRNTWALLQQNPWTGVGWGEFNLAWTMTPFPDRPVAFFDHCHNLVMQLLVELGWPLGLLVLGLLAASIWRACQAARMAQGANAPMLRCAFMLVLMIGLHSMLEYPLWYAYFLLPTACALGLLLGAADDAALSESGALRWPSLPAAVVRIVGGLMAAASIYAVWDYAHIVAIYDPGPNAGSLESRVARGQRSVFFSTLADYAAATTFSPGAQALVATRQTAHNLIDARLMKDWAESLNALGDVDRARYVAARLREFHNAAVADWFAECDQSEARDALPFQCTAPQREYGFREMR